MKTHKIRAIWRAFGAGERPYPAGKIWVQEAAPMGIANDQEFCDEDWEDDDEDWDLIVWL